MWFMKTFTFSKLKNLFTVFFCFVSLTVLKAQSPFSISPATTITSTIDCDSVKDLHFYVVNPNSHDISLDWKVKSNTLPMGNDISGNGGCWNYMLCDWQLCILEIPQVGQVISRMPVKGNSANNDMKLAAVPGQNKGSGTLVIEIFEKNFPSTSKTVTWNITGCPTGNNCTASISESANTPHFIVYPNPVEDFVRVEIKEGYRQNGSIQVYNIVGEKLMEVNKIKNGIQKIDLQKLPAGGYFVKYDNGSGMSVKKIFKVK